MIIKGGKVFTDNFRFEETDVFIEDGKFVADESYVTDKTVIDATGLIVIPGLIDVHTHGAFGHDFCDGDVEGLKQIAAYQRRCGITRFCPTSMTVSVENIKTAFETAGKLRDNGKEYAEIIGINMEGPFIEKSKKGAQNEEYVRTPDYDLFKALNEAAGNLIKLITVAPDVEGAMEFIQKAYGEVNISIGHTMADYDTAAKAFEAGANHVTHLYNAMPPFTHRAPGVIGAARDCKHCFAELIADGFHIHPSVIRATFEMFGDDRIVLVSDSIMATGMEDGEYSLGGLTTYAKDGVVTLADGTLAGSSTNLFECMKRAISFGISPESAVKAATANPAKSIGVFDNYGSITPGKAADVLLLSEDFDLIKVV
ncbi:MAG: N-acetylglucosamine-6-phosphate deacetylase [Ruminococcaceae bacterium]|nr:N-acetylglucosamine-6-phosphate deacetylase [Oscillospiraceae bacterium]